MKKQWSKPQLRILKIEATTLTEGNASDAGEPGS